MNTMKTILAALLVCGAAYGAQDTDISLVEVRNPHALRTWLNANATDAESRLAAGGSVAETLALVNANDAGTAQVTLQADKADDAGDKWGIVASDGGGLLIQSDATSKGTLATKVTIGTTGIFTLPGGATIDNATSSSELNLTETTVKITGIGAITGNATVGGTLDVTGNTTLGGTAAITSNTTVGGTMAVTGVATFTAESVHNLGIDADYITTDADAGIDVKSTGTLMVGAATADKVEIADSGVETEVQGTLDVHGGLAVTEDVSITLDATDEKITIAQTSAAGTASTPLIFINDDREGATANETTEATLVIDAEGVYGIAITDGALSVQGVTALTGALTASGGILATDVDAATATTMLIGKATADKVEIADSGVETEVQGTLDVHGGLAVTEDVSITLDATDEKITIAQTSAAGTASTPLIFINDDREGATANETTEATLVIDAEGVYGIAITDGALSVQGVTALTGALTASGGILATDVDAATGVTMLIGKATATRVEIADTTIITEIEGPLVATEDIDSDELDAETATALLLGKATATSVEIGATDAHTKIMGGIKGAYVAKTATYTNTVNDFVISYTTSEITTNRLPEASTVLGSIFVISLFGATGDLVVETDGTDKFSGTPNDIVTMADAGDSLMVMATGANAYTILSNTGGTLGGD